MSAVSQTLPLLTGGMNQAATSALSGTNRIVQARLDSNRGMSSGDVPAESGYLWVKPFYSKADQLCVMQINFGPSTRQTKPLFQ